MKRKNKTRSENVESKLLVAYAFELSRKLGISKMLVHADELRDINLVEQYRDKEDVIWLTRNAEDFQCTERKGDFVVAISTTYLKRMDQVYMGLFLSVLSGYIHIDESVLCLSGIAGSERLDTLVITNPRRDYPWFQKFDVAGVRDLTTTREFGRLIEIALRFAAEGREGKPIGTLFVLGSLEELNPYIRQLILNPCEGHPQKHRNIQNPEFLETLRELSALDGAFIINKKGVVELAGTYIDAPLRKTKLRPGLGSRHAAAAAVTTHSNSVAVVISESSRTVSVFHEGKAIFEFEKPSATIKQR